jgi:hypothetical protein
VSDHRLKNPIYAFQRHAIIPRVPGITFAMMHLLPIRWMLRIALGAVGLAMVAATYAGWVGSGKATRDAALVVSWSSIAAISLIILFFAVWRWIPPLQRAIFPYLGGRWTGYLEFEVKKDLERREVTLEVKHTLFGLRLLLDTKESSSWTLSVLAERDPDFPRYRLFYAYVNERKDGFVNAGERYRGLAVMRLELGAPAALHGSYFTDARRSGTLHLNLTQRNPWWMLWR